MASLTDLRGSVRVAVGERVISDLVSLEFRGRHSGPPVVEADLAARVVLLDGEGGEIVVIVLDLLELFVPWMQRFKAAVRRFTGIAEDRQIVLCNHIHSSCSSDGIAEVPLSWRVAEAVADARKRLAPAEIASASRALGGGWTITRRFAIDDLDTFCVMFNDDCVVEGDRLEVSGQVAKHLQSRGVDPAEWSGAQGKAYCDPPPDTRLELVSLRSLDGEPIATIARFPVHPVLTSHVQIGNRLYPDFMHAMREVVEARLGGMMLYVQGPMGDIKPLRQGYGIDVAVEYGRRLADETVSLASEMKWQPLDVVRLARQDVPLPLRDAYFWTDQQRESRIAELRQQADVAGSVADRLERLRQAAEIHWAQSFLDRCSLVTPDIVEAGTMTGAVAALRLGGVRLVGLPGEVFCQTGETVRSRADERAVTLELLDGYVGYVSTAEAYHTGGYEDGSCVLAVEAEGLLVDAAVTVLTELA